MRKIILLLLAPITLMLTSGCPPTQTHEETVTIYPSNWNTLTDTDSGGDLCRGGLAPDTPGPGQMIVGFSHRYENNSGCWVNQVYEGLLRYQIDAAPFNRRFVTSATLTLNVDRVNANPAHNSCIDKLALTDVQWWALPNTTRIHIDQLRNIRQVPSQSLTIDVTQEVLRWANGTEPNNGFIFIGQRPELSDFSNTGMLTNESCEAFYSNIALKVTFLQFTNPPHHRSISVSSVHTQTTSDITVDGTDFTPNATVSIFADNVPGRMGSFPLGTAPTDPNGKFHFFNRSLCTRQPDSVTIRALDESSGDNARGTATVFCR